MKIEQKQWTADSGWTHLGENKLNGTAQLVLAFGDKEALLDPERFNELKEFYPGADLLTCSTAGEILDESVNDGTINATIIEFEKTKVRSEIVTVSDPADSYSAGKQIIEKLGNDDLTYALVISDWSLVNGDELTKALAEDTKDGTVVTGGMAGDGPNFNSTLVGLNEAPANGNIVGIGFYGDSLKIGHAARGGWDPFGPERLVTKSSGNILYELDGQSALDLYKKYLGDLANELPSSALLFPLGLKLDEGSDHLVRTILGTDEETKSITFAGDIPEGSVVRMLKSNFERIIDGASKAAKMSIDDFGSFDPDLAILISCAGRKFALGHRIEEEVERVKEVLGDNTFITGFYAYGEISPIVNSTKCQLHNQTMTITTLKELV